MMDDIDIMGLVVIAIGLLILSPILAYTLYRFHQIRRVPIMKFRNLPLIYAINILVLFTIAIERTCVCSVLIWNISIVPEWTPKLCDVLCVWLIYLVFAIRTWLLYFERKHHLSLVNLTWKKLINQYTKSWHISHNYKYGNYKYLLKISSIPYITYILIELICNLYLQSDNFPIIVGIISTFIHWIFTIFPLLFCCLLYYKFRTNKLKNISHISNEIKYECILIISYLFVNALVLIICTCFKNEPNIYKIETFVTMIFTDVLLFGIAILTTVYPLFVHHTQSKESELSQFQRNKASPTGTKCDIQQIVKLLANIDGFKHFMLHLLHEYSTENLVFLVEYIQIKYAFQQRNNQLILVPKHPIYKSHDWHVWHPSNPSFGVVAPSNSPSLSSSCESQKAHATNMTPDILETAITLAVSNKKHQEQCTESTITCDTERAAIDFEDDHKYMVLDFNPIEAIHNPIRERSPSPPLPPSNVASAEADELPSTRVRAATESVNSAVPMHPPTFLERARSMSLSRTFSKKRKEEHVFTYLLNNNGTLFMKMQLPAGLPQSAVLDDPLKANNFSLQMEYLYNKFVKLSAFMEVNISHGLRAPLIELFESNKSHLKQPKESFLFTVFDEVAHSILDLMLDSYRRFIVTDAFKEVEAELVDVDGSYALHVIDETMSTLEKEEKTTPCTQTDATPKTPSAINMNDSEINSECNIIRNASSFNKLMMLYETR